MLAGCLLCAYGRSPQCPSRTLRRPSPTAPLPAALQPHRAQPPPRSGPAVQRLARQSPRPSPGLRASEVPRRVGYLRGRSPLRALLQVGQRARPLQPPLPAAAQLQLELPLTGTPRHAIGRRPYRYAPARPRPGLRRAGAVPLLRRLLRRLGTEAPLLGRPRPVLWCLTPPRVLARPMRLCLRLRRFGLLAR